MLSIVHIYNSKCMYNICIKVYIDRKNALDERKIEKEENVLYLKLTFDIDSRSR